MPKTAKVDDHSHSARGKVIAELTADGWVRIKKGALETHDFVVDVHRNGDGNRVAGVVATLLAPDSKKGGVNVVDGFYLKKS